MSYWKNILLAALSLGSAAALCAQSQAKYKPLEGLKEIAFLQSNDPNAEEKAALDFFETAYPNAYVITPEDFNQLKAEDLDYLMIWIHADRAGLEKGWSNLAEYYAVDGDTDTFITKLKDASQIRGVNLYLSGHAVQFVEGMERIDATYPINLFEANGNTTTLDQTWAVSSKIEDQSHGDHDGFAMFGYINDDWASEMGYTVKVTKGDYENNEGVYPVLGPAGLKVDNNNCMWTEVDDLNEFNRLNNAQIQGTWGWYSGAVKAFGIVEFLPDDATAVENHVNRDWKGNILVNGLAACQWAPEGTNEFAYNLQDMTFNAINYLAKRLDKDLVLSAIRDIDSDSALEDVPTYYTLGGVRISAPAAPGLYVKVCGGCAEKVIIR